MRYVYSLIFMCCSVNAAFGVSLWKDMLRLHAHDFITIPYISVDTDNNPVVLSASICYPTASIFDMTPTQVKFVVLDNHPTICMDSQSPSGENPLGSVPVLAPKGFMTLMTAEDAVVISCDYLGYGYSKNKVHPYCNHLMEGRNIIDGFLAAMDTLKNRGIQIASDYYTLSVGYSQGGGVTMAVQKYLETVASDEVKKLVNLKHSYCGAGPYDLPLTYKELVEGGTLAYACSLPMTVQGLYHAYKNGCMRLLNPDDIYTSKEFRVGVEKVINSKETDTDGVNAWINEFFGKENVSASDFVRQDVLDHSSAASKMLDKALSKSNLLDGTWTPQIPITLWHFSGDNVVPYANSVEAATVFGNAVRLYTEKDEMNIDSVLKETLKRVKPDPQSHSDYGIFFFAYFVDGALRDAWSGNK